LIGKPEDERPLVYMGVDGRIIVGWIVETWDERVWTGSE
jgi:hypothetical protein